mmetsp:Transcript_18627/g.46109  ORF Transcript_18627/g.46109 Transcript_18627/m.46109 type:complete len:350 (-) Transcript_18627:46-1095(-)|eukprot:CAMPEP_0113621374 /NCGR_PEP_ID=MMETSP0017_2-20120614/10920_1 /TAXON_ID=2856 /ORGANISM="Cylindrotheca closterium" /LENGTH=349 /DNA_ID=CAMNT_0000531113 /DNA_START=49 /DNA_END=1098 /DNA_ORIENTATION=- /assembly_acc=CAM_ASM_000147
MSAFGSNTGNRANSIAPQDCNVPQAGNDGISSLVWSPTANFLMSTNWDGGVRCWEVQEQGGQVRASPKAQVNHEAQSPALDCCFSPDGSTVFSGGADKAVRMWKLGESPPGGIAQQIGVHDAPVKAVGFLPSGLVVSGGWDRKLKFWDTRTNNPVGTLDMPERVYDLDVRGNLMVAITANRRMMIYNVGTPQPNLVQNKESPLKFQSRCVSCFPDQTGFAIGGVEGRVGIQYVQKVGNKDHFAFKCHRKDNNAFSVNAIAFQNQYGTFATCGADGVVNFWDKDNKQRLKGFNPIQRSIPCAAFNAQGNLFAYASSYDWSKGSGYHSPGSPNEIYIHYTPDNEIKPKAKR